MGTRSGERGQHGMRLGVGNGMGTRSGERGQHGNDAVNFQFYFYNHQHAREKCENLRHLEIILTD